MLFWNKTQKRLMPAISIFSNTSKNFLFYIMSLCYEGKNILKERTFIFKRAAKIHINFNLQVFLKLFSKNLLCSVSACCSPLLIRFQRTFFKKGCKCSVLFHILTLYTSQLINFTSNTLKISTIILKQFYGIM